MSGFSNKKKNKVQQEIKQQKEAISQEEARQNAKAEETLRKSNEESEAQFSQEGGESVELEKTEAQKEIVRLKKENAELQKKVNESELRQVAAIQNLQRRHQTELEEENKYAATKFAREMLTIKDYLEMALADNSGNFEALKMGVEMTLKELISAFNSVSIEEINPKGESFDSNYHDAIKEEPSDLAPNTVLEVKRKGYSMKGRLLRPAQVVVSKK